MQNRYVGDIGDYLKLGILRALSPGYRLGVAWWLFSDEAHNGDGRHIAYLNRPEQWRHFDPDLFDILLGVVSSGQRNVRALEASDILPGTIFSGEVVPSDGLLAQRRQARHEWFARMKDSLMGADLVFVDPDNGLEPAGYRRRSAKAGKSVLLSELGELARPGRCLIVYHHHSRRKGGHQCEIVHWVDRLRTTGFATVDALRARPYSPRVYFLLNAPADVRRRAEQISLNWQRWITWHPDQSIGGDAILAAEPRPPLVTMPAASLRATSSGASMSSPQASGKPHRRGASITTKVGYANRNGQEVIRPTRNPGTDHGQYVYVLRCRACGHEYGANGSDIWLRRCPAHDRGAPGLPF
jgi:hypothetical protein